MRRRTVLAGLGAGLVARPLRAQEKFEWGAPVIDMHWHMHRTLEANLAHLDGAGITAANLLTSGDVADLAHGFQTAQPARFPAWFAATDIARPDAGAFLTDAVKRGARGLGEIKFPLAADGPELRRIYALAGELDVPILVHFQDDELGSFEPGWQRFAAMLKAFPRTRFIGHANAFWAYVSADYQGGVAYPTGPVSRGGITDKLLADFPNLYGDMSANSGNNALSRDPDFTRDFLIRHQDKLHFGSDCNCNDGHGGGPGQNNPAVAARIRGKCVARETLTVLKAAAAPAVFEKLVWSNGRRLLKLA